MNWNIAQNLAWSNMDQQLPIGCFHRLTVDVWPFVWRHYQIILDVESV